MIFDEKIRNAAILVLHNLAIEKSSHLKILHYLYLNGIDIHFLTKTHSSTQHHSIYSLIKSFKKKNIKYENIDQYLKVISQDFDYLHNEHDDELYRKPSFWNEIDDRNIINHRNNNIADEQSIRVNEWKNRFEEHVIHHLSKMIQQHMRQSNETF